MYSMQWHAILCCLNGRYSPDDQGYLFPCFANMRKGGASTKVTNIMKNCVGKVEGVTDKMTASGLRVGSTDEMVFSPKINDIVAIMRGAWYFEGDSRMYYYLTKRAHVSKGGLVLGNHEDPNKVVPMYRLDSIMTGKIGVLSITTFSDYLELVQVRIFFVSSCGINVHFSHFHLFCLFTHPQKFISTSLLCYCSG